METKINIKEMTAKDLIKLLRQFEPKQKIALAQYGLEHIDLSGEFTMTSYNDEIVLLPSGITAECLKYGCNQRGHNCMPF